MPASLNRRQWLIASMANLYAARAALAQTASGPSHERPIEVIYGFEAGGAGSQLGELLTRRINTFNHPRMAMRYITADGSRRACEVARGAPPDGTTLLQAASFTMLLYPHIYRTLGYSVKDFELLARLGRFTYSLTVGPRVPLEVDSLQSYLSWVEANPAERNYGVFGHGSSPHLAGMTVNRNMNVALRAQTYSGNRSVIRELLNRTLSAAFTPAGLPEEAFRSGQLRSIGVTSGTRWPGMEHIPTLREQGVQDLDLVDWIGWFAPAGIAPDKAERLRQAIHQGLDGSEVMAFLQDGRIQPAQDRPEDYAALLEQDSANFLRMARLNRLSIHN